jgi:bifunctional UDP-N-acetylglucosamine pyrophosphorylase/glucosamine-1-phosphate N-acetyltransferase
MRRTLVVPAAGMGTRLRSTLPKPLTLVMGRPMILHILARFQPYCERAVIVIHPSTRAALSACLSSSPLPIVFAEQPEPTGMLDAILLSDESVRSTRPDRVWICWCDQVLLRSETLDRVAARERELPTPSAVFPTSVVRDPYIHFDRDPTGKLIAVRQRREGDSMPDTGETDSGVFAVSTEAFTDRLSEYAADAAIGKRTGERNFLPFFPWLARYSLVATVPVEDTIETMGINSPEELAAAESYLRTRDD